MSVARLVCVEGIDGAGKTTLVHGLAQALGALGLRAGTLHSNSLAQLSLGQRSELDDAALTLQDKAFVAASRLLSFYLAQVVPRLGELDVLLVDRYTWSFMVRWGCLGVPWGVLTALGAMPGLVPPPAHTLLLRADPAVAYQRKLAAGIALSRAETRGRALGQSEGDAFIGLQRRALGFYEDLCSHAAAGTVTQIDSAAGAGAVLQRAGATLRAVLGR